MPSHLDDPKKIHKRRDALATGLCRIADLNGNVVADQIAERGARLHQVPQVDLMRADDHLSPPLSCATLSDHGMLGSSATAIMHPTGMRKV